MKGPPRIWRFRRMLIFGLALLFLAPVDGTALLFALQDKKDEPAEEREKRPTRRRRPAASRQQRPRPSTRDESQPSANRQRRPRPSGDQQSARAANQQNRPPRRPRPRPRRRLRTVTPAEWRALAKEITAANGAISQQSRRTAAGLQTRTRRPAPAPARHYRQPGDERRAAGLRRQLADHPGDLNAVLQLADLARRNYHFDAAEQHLQQALIIEPLNQDFLIDLGKLYESFGRLAQAYAAYQEVIFLNGEHPEARLAQAGIRDQEGDGAAAAAILEEVALQQGRSAAHYYYAVLHRSAVGEHRAGIRLAEEGLNRYPDEARIYAARGRAYASLGINDRAKVNYYDALALDGNNLAVLLLLGRLSEEERQHDVAVRSFRLVLENHPGEPVASLGLGRAYLKDLRLAEAEGALALHRQLHGSSPELSRLLAQTYYLLSLQSGAAGRYHEALEYQSQSRRTAQTDRAGWVVPALLWAGQAEALKGRQQKAAKYFHQAVAMNPFSIEGHLGLSRVYLAFGELTKAGFYRREAARLGAGSVPRTLADRPAP